MDAQETMRGCMCLLDALAEAYDTTGVMGNYMGDALRLVVKGVQQALAESVEEEE